MHPSPVHLLACWTFFIAISVYRHNFPGVNHGSANVCGIKPEALEKKGVEAIFMSPPCQPFTRQGLQKDLGVWTILSMVLIFRYRLALMTQSILYNRGIPHGEYLGKIAFGKIGMGISSKRHLSFIVRPKLYGRWWIECLLTKDSWYCDCFDSLALTKVKFN